MTESQGSPSIFRPAKSEVMVRDLVVKSNLPAADFVANPYTGCQMACRYCYATFMKKWSGHLDDEWGAFVGIKVNAPELVNQRAHAGKDILFSSVTDAYQASEGKYQITRKSLEKLASLTPQPTVEVLTKSNLVVRDIDVLKRFGKVTVGFSFSTLDDQIRRVMEPVTPVIARRLKAVEQVHSAGIRTYVFVSPILPYLTDVDAIIDRLREHVDFFMFENLNVRPYIWPPVKAALQELDPELIPKYEAIYFDKQAHSNYWAPIEEAIRSRAARDGFTAKMFFHHTSKAKSEPRSNQQTE
jgi:DNA repair photolyase